MVRKEKIVLVGAGGLATNLGKALLAAGHEVAEVYSRTVSAAEKLADILSCSFTTNISSINCDADIYIIAVKDDALQSVAREIIIGREKALFLHTAGSMPMSLLERAERYGVLYPMQTFSKSRTVDFSEIPVFVEGNNSETEEAIEHFAMTFSANVRSLPSEKRKYLHLAAVYACNFANHCYAKAEEVLSTAGLPFSVMLPLIDETALKVHSLSPKDAQTGPAVRFDKAVMQAHCLLLEKEDAELYMNLSRSIKRNKEK